MSKLGVRGVEAFNERVRKAKEKGEQLKRTVQTGFDRETGKPVYEDETARARAHALHRGGGRRSGRPDDDLRQGDRRRGAASGADGARRRHPPDRRHAAPVASTSSPARSRRTSPPASASRSRRKIDSRTILGEQGAEQLLGQGDMLYMMAGGRIRRVHGPFVTDSEVEDVVRFLKTQGRPNISTPSPKSRTRRATIPTRSMAAAATAKSGDDLYDKALAIVARERKATTSYIQRRLEIGYNRAARLIERMEEDGVISTPQPQGRARSPPAGPRPGIGEARESVQRSMRERVRHFEGDPNCFVRLQSLSRCPIIDFHAGAPAASSAERSPNCFACQDQFHYRY